MSYPAIHEIVIGGKKYIDLALLEKQIQSVYPLKSHSLRRLARYGRIPHKRIGMSRKDWFNLAEVKQALNLVLEDDPQLVDTDNPQLIDYLENVPDEVIQGWNDYSEKQASAIDFQDSCEEEDYLGDM
jgi:hypothetical protein